MAKIKYKRTEEEQKQFLENLIKLKAHRRVDKEELINSLKEMNFTRA